MILKLSVAMTTVVIGKGTYITVLHYCGLLYHPWITTVWSNDWQGDMKVLDRNLPHFHSASQIPYDL